MFGRISRRCRSPDRNAGPGMSRRLYCAHCRGVWVSAAAHGIARDLERCPHCGGPLTLEKPRQVPDKRHRDNPRPSGDDRR